MLVKKLSPQNGGFFRAKLARPRTFCAKANGIPYLIILCPKPTSQELESQLTEQARPQEEKKKNQDIQEMVAESINEPGVEVDEQEDGQWIQEHPENKR